jgi:hypothetical protein
MRTLVGAIVSLVIGLGVGLSLTAYEFNGVTERFEAYGAETKTYLERLARVVVVNGDTYDFGTLAREQSREHVFVLRNDGLIPLHVAFHEFSCGRCVSTTFTRQAVSPNETAEVLVNFATRKTNPKFSEYMEVTTNDYDVPILRLTIEGDVTERVRLSVADLSLGSVSSSQETYTKFELYGYESEELEMLDYQMADPATADRYEIVTTPIDVSVIDVDPKPIAGLKMAVTIKPGLPVGPISQTIRILAKAGTPEAVGVEMPVFGMVVSDVSVIGGSNYSRARNMVRLGAVGSSDGANATLRLLVKGPARDTIKLFVESIEPAVGLKAELGDVTKTQNGLVHLYELKIEVPKGVPPMIHLGNKQGELGKIVVGTTHPDAKQVQVFVQFSVE